MNELAQNKVKTKQKKNLAMYWSPVRNIRLPTKIHWVHSLTLETNYMEMEKRFPGPFENS